MTAEVQLPVQMSLPLANSAISPSDSGMGSDSALSHTHSISPDRNSTDSDATIITIRIIMQGKEVGMVIGKKGENVKRYREESGAKINISDASCPERIVTVTGAVNQLNKAFYMMCTKMEEIREKHAEATPGTILPPMSFKLVIPASQCGSLIGKHGNKIKEIREISSASVQVATDMLPGSTERTVNVSGSATAIISCLREICAVMHESPPKGATIPYRPKTAIQAPFMYAAAVGAAAQAGYTLPPHMHQMAAVNLQQQATGQIIQQQLAAAAAPNSQVHTPAEQRQHSAASQSSPLNSSTGAALSVATSASPYPHPSQLAQLQVASHHHGTPLILPPQCSVGSAPLPYGSLINPVASLGMMSAMGNVGAGYLNRPLNGNFMAAAAAAQQQTQSSEMIIPNEVIGCVIGRGGAKINEIRQLSGAQIKINNCEEGSSDRRVTITGFPETISMAAFLINTSIELHKNQLLNTDSSGINTTVSAQQNVLPASMAGTILPPTVVSPTYSKPLGMNPYAANPALYGLAPNPLAGLAGYTAYDPKAFLNASKLKVLPSNSAVKQDHRFAPY